MVGGKKNRVYHRPAIVYANGGGGVDSPVARVIVVDSFEVSNGYRREGAHKWSFMYSLLARVDVSISVSSVRRRRNVLGTDIYPCTPVRVGYTLLSCCRYV